MSDKILTVRFTPEMDVRIAAQAKREDLSKNQLIRKAVRNYLAAVEPQDSSTPTVAKGDIGEK